MNASTESCGCHGEPARAQTDPAYRRALLTVVVLNLGFGVAELFGGSTTVARTFSSTVPLWKSSVGAAWAAPAAAIVPAARAAKQTDLNIEIPSC